MLTFPFGILSNWGIWRPCSGKAWISCDKHFFVRSNALTLPTGTYISALSGKLLPLTLIYRLGMFLGLVTFRLLSSMRLALALSYVGKWARRPRSNECFAVQMELLFEAIAFVILIWTMIENASIHLESKKLLALQLLRELQGGDWARCYYQPWLRCLLPS